MNKIKQLRTLLEKSSPGPWLAREGDVLNPDRTYGIVRVLSPEEHGCDPEEGERTEVIAELLAAYGGVDAVDADLIALMKNTLPALLEAYGLLHDAHGLFGWLLDEFLLDYDGEPYEDEAAARVKGICMSIRDLNEALK